MKYPHLSTGHFAAASLRCKQPHPLEGKVEEIPWGGGGATPCTSKLWLRSLAPSWHPTIGDGPPPSNEELRSIQPVLWAAEEVGVHSRTSGLQMQVRWFFFFNEPFLRGFDPPSMIQAYSFLRNGSLNRPVDSHTCKVATQACPHGTRFHGRNE